MSSLVGATVFPKIGNHGAVIETLAAKKTILTGTRWAVYWIS